MLVGDLRGDQVKRPAWRGPLMFVADMVSRYVGATLSADYSRTLRVFNTLALALACSHRTTASTANLPAAYVPLTAHLWAGTPLVCIKSSNLLF